MRRPRQPRTSNLDLDVPGCLGNIDRLDTHLTVDDVRFAPCAYMVAQDIVVGTGAWASRHDTSKILSVAGAGADPTYGNATAIENSAVKYAAAKYHAAADTTWGQLDTDDGALECVFALGTVASQTVLTTYASNTGISLTTDGSGNLLCSMRDGTGGLVTLHHNALVAGAWYYVWAGIDRSEKAYLYVNGVAAATTPSASVTGIALTWTSAALILGSTAPQIAYAALWDMAGTPWPGALKNATYMARIARERFAIVVGIQDRRQGAHTFTRATPAYLDKYTTPTSTERWLHRVSAGWPRICQRKDANNRTVAWMLSEPQATNLATYSEDMASWTAENLTTVSANGMSAANGTTTADGLVANASDTTHGVYAAYTLPATNHCLSAFVEQGNKTWVELYSSIANVSCYFDIANGVVGTAGAAVTAAGVDTKPYKGIGGIYRVWICFTGSADAKNYGVRAAQANGDNTFAGDTTTVNAWVWGLQIEATAEHFPSSYIPTVAAAVARNKDELAYNVRLPIVGNINDLPQALTIGGSDYQPCAYLVADDVNVSTGAWTSRHAAKSLAFAGAGTNPTPQWDAVSRANKAIKYWASNYHVAADTTWGQVTTGDFAVEIIHTMPTNTGDSARLLCTRAPGLDLYCAGGFVRAYITDGTNNTSLIAAASNVTGSIVHTMFMSDRSENIYLFINGVYSNSASISAITNTLSGQPLAIGAYSDGSNGLSGNMIQCSMWDLTTNPWPGAATNQAVMGAIARARFNALFRYPSCRLDCEILHPNVNRQATASPVSTGVGYPDYQYLGIGSSDVGFAQAVANSVLQWSSGTTLGSTDICNNVSVKLSAKARANLVAYAENNTTQSTDTTAELPAGQTKVLVGQFVDGTIQPTCLVGGVKTWRADK